MRPSQPVERSSRPWLARFALRWWLSCYFAFVYCCCRVSKLCEDALTLERRGYPSAVVGYLHVFTDLNNCDEISKLRKFRGNVCSSIVAHRCDRDIPFVASSTVQGSWATMEKSLSFARFSPIFSPVSFRSRRIWSHKPFWVRHFRWIPRHCASRANHLHSSSQPLLRNDGGRLYEDDGIYKICPPPIVEDWACV